MDEKLKAKYLKWALETAMPYGILLCVKCPLFKECWNNEGKEFDMLCGKILHELDEQLN